MDVPVHVVSARRAKDDDEACRRVLARDPTPVIRLGTQNSIPTITERSPSYE